MFNYIKIYLYKFIPIYLYNQIMYLYKKYRLKKINSLLLKKKNYETVINFLKIKKKIKKKIFIFGSGSSIKDLTRQNFKEIERNYSIGINKWIFHDFITDYYMIELKTNKYNSLKGFSNLNTMYKKRIINLLKIRKKKPIFLIYCPKYKLLEMQNWIKGINPKRIFFYDYIRPNISKKNLKKEFAQTLKYILETSKVSNIVSLGIGSSVERAVSLSIILGFLQVVILGVDLKNRRYFWNKKDKNFKGLRVKQKGSGLHKTAVKKSGNLPIQNSIKIIDQIARKYYGSKILISTNKSILSAKLEKYNWIKKM